MSGSMNAKGYKFPSLIVIAMHKLMIRMRVLWSKMGITSKFRERDGIKDNDLAPITTLGKQGTCHQNSRFS